MKKLLIISLTLLLVSSAIAQWPYQHKPMLGMQIDKSHQLGDFVGAWFMLEGSGSKIFDLSGNGLVGSLEVNAAWSASSYGPSVEVFDDESAINFGTDSRFDFTSEDFTLIVLWGSATDPSFNRRIISRSSTGANGWSLEVDFPIDQLAFKTNSGAGTIETTSKNVIASPYDGTIYHIVITRSGTSVRIYINGVDQTDTAGSHADPATVSTNMYLGRGTSLGQDVPGKYAGYWVYKRVLSVSEIVSHYREPFGMFEDSPIVKMFDYGGAPPAGGGQVIMIQMGTIAPLVVLLAGSIIYMNRGKKAA